MNWIQITAAEIATHQAGAMITAMQTAALRTGQTDPLAEAIAQTTLEIRAAVKSGGFKCDADTSKIPAELRKDAVALVVEVAKPRIKQALTADEVRLADAARAKLSKIAEGKISVSAPDAPEPSDDTQAATPGASIVRPARSVPQKSDFNGL